MVIFAAAVLTPQKCDAWKIELEPFEKLPMYSANNLSFKLHLENGECQVGLCNNFDDEITTVSSGDREHYQSLQNTNGLTVHVKPQNNPSSVVSIEHQDIVFQYDDIR